MTRIAMTAKQFKYIEHDCCPLCGNKLTTTKSIIDAESIYSLNCICIPCQSAFLVTWQGKYMNIVSGWQTDLKPKK